MTSTPARYEPVVGMEVHCQLSTKSKLFCPCSTAFGAPPNSQVCPVCAGLPGVLPVLNKRAVEMAVTAGLATGCSITPFSRFARKNYFYPDLPKGYQISQYELPVCQHGALDITLNGATKRVRIRRIHLEEDAGKNLHEGIAEASHVDLNRAGVPLLEIVSEPDLHSVDEAVAYLKMLRELMVHLGISDGNMEEGSFRCEPNLSLRPAGSATLGSRVEMKNINSFRFAQHAMEYEIVRQTKLLERGDRVAQETRLWDPDRGVTATMRSKEEAHDYRYFPEPDLVPLQLPASFIDERRRALPELPAARRQRYRDAYGLSDYDAGVLTATPATAAFFEASLAEGAKPKAASNWITVELFGHLNKEGRAIEQSPVSAAQLAGLLALIDQGVVSATLAKSVFEKMYQTGRDARRVIEEEGLAQVSDTGELERLIDEVCRRHAAEVEAYRQGKEKLFGFLVGQAMKASGGRANPAEINRLLKQRLAGQTGT
ncbi:MAG TPA: Asp-tRNA(Asn)/Glu-tRNA(Gln) amidotransferase subunit GatB [Nitrospiria bacterium]|nr:Asp-tRNA(Asn)/Glu-tRNA(Gln) amidotransferase subunit GatB [Nitrospiria bacterium]